MSRNLRLPDQAAADALQERLTGKVEREVTLTARVPEAYKVRSRGTIDTGRSPAELARQIRLASLPSPVLEYPFAKPERDYRADLAWPSLRLIVEVDGAVHRIKERFSADLLRDQVIFFLGWRKLRVSPRQVANGEALTLVQRALATR